jgi:uncharacterized protein
MRDGALRSFVKRNLARLYARQMEARRARLARRGALHWELAGECGACAACCEAPTIVVGALLYFAPLLGRAWLFWQRTVNGFELVGRLREERAFVFRCTHFDPVTRRCDSYDSRPGMCRDYPRMLLEAPDPEFFAKCGYRARAHNADALLTALRDKGVGGDQLVQIRRRLRLD